MRRRALFALIAVVAMAAVVMGFVLFRTPDRPRQGTALQNLDTPGTWGTSWSTSGLATVSSPPLGDNSSRGVRINSATLELAGCGATILRSRAFWLTSSQGYVAVLDRPIIVGAAGGGLFISKGHGVANLALTSTSPAFFIAFLVRGDRTCTLHVPSATIRYDINGVGGTYQVFHHPIILHPFTWRS